MCMWFNVYMMWVLVVLYRSGHVQGAPRMKFNHECKQPRGDACVEIWKCPYFADMLESTKIPRPRHVIKVIREHQCGFIANIPKVCCTFPAPTQPPPSVMVMAEEGRAGNEIISDLLDPPDVSDHKQMRLLPHKEQCGIIGNEFRITGGSQTSPGEFPWMALIAYMTKDGLDFRCGGSLISERYVLTAAHCVLNMTMVGVRLGEHNINSREDCDEATGKCSPPVQDFYIEKLVVHPGYIPSTFTNDIALIRLATAANITFSNVRPVCLPVGDLAKYNLDRKFATVSGWGVTETGFKSAELLKIAIPVISSRDCRKIYKKYAPISDKQICAGGVHGRDSCGGDSGGPLIYVNSYDGSPRYVQHGIVSYGPRHCGTEGQPGVYTRIAHYMDWILDNMKE